MYLTIQGIVLRVTDYNDKDALLTMLTRRHGRLTVKARGLRRKNSPLIAPCQLLHYSNAPMLPSAMPLYGLYLPSFCKYLRNNGL